MRAAPSIAIPLLLAGCAASPLPQLTDETGGPGRNVLILLVDDLGIDKIDAYGEQENVLPTPNIDALAARGVLFRNAWAHGAGTPTRAVLLTGRHARRLGFGDALRPTSKLQLPLNELTIPEMLAFSALSYDTAALGKWQLAGADSSDYLDHPLAQGFRTHAGAPGNLDDYFLWAKSRDGVGEMSSVYATTDTVDDALAEIHGMHTPWFTYVSFNAPHTPVHLPPASLRPEGVDEDSDDAALYESMIWALDLEIGRLLDGMGPDLVARTTIVLMSDNGTDGDFAVQPVNSGHVKGTVYEGGVNVPLIIAGPWVTHPGSESQALVHAVDLFPTVAEIAGVDVDPLTRHDGTPAEIDGHSLLRFLRDPSAAPIHETLYTEAFTPNGVPPYRETHEVVRDGRYKYAVHDGDEDEGLYDLSQRTDDGPNLLADPRGLSEEAADAYDALSTALSEIRAEVRYEGPGAP